MGVENQAPLASIGSMLNNIIGPAIVSTGTVAPTCNIHHITGTVPMATITVPYAGFQGAIKFIPDGTFTTVTTGNIALASTAVVSKTLEMTFDGSKWNPSY